MDKPKIGVVGLGTMGLGIAQVFAQAGFHVIATDMQTAARGTATARLAKALDARVAAGKLNADQRHQTMAQFEVVDALSELHGTKLVIEAIIEDLDTKQSLLAKLEGIVSRGTVLATNTSSLSVTGISRGLKHPERLLGLHFFNPAPAMKLVECIVHAGTGPEPLALARAVCEATGKVVITCADRPGFIVNRCARPFYGEALAMLEEGRNASDIDAAMLSAGYRIGPLSLIDLIGADINLAATKGLAAAMGGHPRYHVFKSLLQQVDSGDLGRKSGKGFIFPSTPGATPPDAVAIALRIEAALANEAASLLDEGTIDETAIDTAMRLGLNFPRGPFQAARAQGLDRIRATLHALEAAAPVHLKGRYAISPALQAMR